ncbi:MAG: radical SAM protein [Candidatus Schekmanbacteria bacterium]|nr:radical SAM protein [Candidatus Schekmanbacteria bacterium]
MNIRLIESPLAIPRYRQVRLPTVAAELAPGADVEINDANLEPVDYSRADVVGFTAQAYNAPWAIQVAARFRELGIPTMVGGPYATSAGEAALQHFDAVVVGEIEGLGERLTADARAGRLRGVYRLDEPPRDWGVRLPRRDLLDNDRYYWFNYPLELTRGCPHRCSFCSGRLSQPGFRVRRLEDIAADLEQWDHGLVEVVDLNFAANRRFIVEVCGLFERIGVAGWFGEATLLSLDSDYVLEHLARSNCKAVFVGIESVDPQTLASVGKRFNQVEEYRRIIEKIQSHGIFVHAGLIWGLDEGSGPAAAEAVARLLEQMSLYLATSNVATYYPGTRAHAELVAAGRALESDARAYDGAHVISSAGDDASVAAATYAAARAFNRRFYSLRSIFRRSFQAPCYRLSQLVDYWSFNLVYRSYYRKWSRRLGGRSSPWPHQAGVGSVALPFVGGAMPPIYSLMDRSWRFFHQWYAAWSRPAGAVSAAVSLAASAAFGGASLLVWQGAPEAVAAAVAAPLAAFVAAYLCAAGLITIAVRSRRRAAVPAVDDGCESGAGTVSGQDAPKSSAESVPQVAAALLAIGPLWLWADLLPAGATAWRFAAGTAALILLLKAASVLGSPSLRDRNPLRVLSFLLLYPTLDFATAFVLSGDRRPLTRHVPLAWSGALKLSIAAAGVPLLIAAQILYFPRIPAAVGSLARYGLAYLMLAGALQLLTAYWRMAGYALCEPKASRPFGPAWPSEIWRAWNPPLHRWLAHHVYRRCGGREAPVRATVAAFAAAGALLALGLQPVVGRLPVTVIGYFLVGAMPVAIEACLRRRWRSAPPPATRLRAALYAGTVLLALATGPWLFGVTDRIYW